MKASGKYQAVSDKANRYFYLHGRLMAAIQRLHGRRVLRGQNYFASLVYKWFYVIERQSL